MRRDQPDKVVLVCQWQGRSDRYFGKYKSFETGKWLKVPGGAFPPAFDTKEKALMFAREWYEQAEADHQAQLAAVKPRHDATWDEICDAYIAEVKARMRGKPSTRHEAITVTNASFRRGILATRKPSENDENRCLLWLRALVTETITAGEAAALSQADDGQEHRQAPALPVQVRSSFEVDSGLNDEPHARRRVPR
jgi:hypothetical protein